MKLNLCVIEGKHEWGQYTRIYTPKKESALFVASQIWVQIPALALMSSVTSGSCLTSLSLNFLTCEMGPGLVLIDYSEE